MTIDELELKLHNWSDEKMASVVALMIEAARDYPQKEIRSITDYLVEISRLLGNATITVDALQRYLDSSPIDDDELQIWRISSITSLLEAIELMKLYGISLDQLLIKIDK
jgi:hypothetical protein